MKILHTADWHLGRSLGGFDLLEDQVAAIDEIARIAKEEQPHAIVIAGDIYDRSVPSEAAMAVFEDALHRLREVAPILAIAGNHDGAGRVGHLSRLLRDAGIHIAATEFGPVPSVTLADDAGEVRFHLMPFATPLEVRHALQADGIDSHESATRARIDTIERASGVRHVLVGHLFTQSGGQSEESESERDISVGGTAVVNPSLFDGFDYVALGHLHKPHDVRSGHVSSRLRYAGSIARYSFSEESHQKSVTIVELDGNGATTLRSLEIPQRIGMRTIRGCFDDIFAKVMQEPIGRSDFVRVQLEDRTPQFEAFRRLRECYPRLVELGYTPRAAAPFGGHGGATSQPREINDPLAMFEDYCRDRLGAQGISDEARSLASALMEEALGNGRSMEEQN